MLRFALAGLLLTACGSSPAPLGLNPAFAGAWYVNGGVQFELADGGCCQSGGGAWEGGQHLVVTVSGSSAQVANVCPGGSSPLTFTGSGNSASWSGNFVCPPFQITVPACDAFVITYSNANLNGYFTSTGTAVDAAANGTGTGCGVVGNVAVDFFSPRP